MFEVVQAAFRQGVLLFFVESGLIDINFTSLFVLRQCLFTNRYFNVMACLLAIRGEELGPEHDDNHSIRVSPSYISLEYCHIKTTDRQTCL